ncbi:MAG: NapC/NirT family cytochrome c [Candidatus Rokubacteria bacterium]|nr:NapC/NirT family cytochrome c [Candidatus Rokubacteria bacterium]
MALAGLVVVAALSVLGLAAKERDDRFCIACHLHDEKFERFTTTPARDLTAAHHVKDVRCIDCHGGADPPMRLRVWTIAAIDTGRFLLGRYKEPERMELPLRSKECTYCHTPIVKNAPALTAEQEEALEGRTGNTYHAIRPHDTVKITCVRCHTSHTPDSRPGLQFIARARVEPICRECHATLGE